MEAQRDGTDTPIFQQIKDFLTAQIAAGHWKEGDVIPSEQALVRQFGVSRMTVNRAVRELTAEAVLTRRQGAGTYVAPQKVQATLLEIRSIADEVRARGHTHRSTLQLLEGGRANELLAKQFDLPAGHALYHSVIVHFENGVPIQVEDRWVNPQCAPAYLDQDFTRITPSEYLVTAAPLQGATYSVEALAAPREIAALLAMDARQPCLVLRRQTRSGGQVASIVTMWHPGHRYQFAGNVA
ncbi:GntR family histidine utilization transcriptional repressor [Pseudoduganella lurida]|uniref:Histidine utilization repressor n=1 Tax=Pseudoduganella lurida TaxID=1036180 RepID=A0A562RAW1_9BURK|nr:histidine utilization repressor [Pseudoduganella lurida]TWI66209.1 GntR family histidine utilization transcriptional repressor [Pseudoduganella lurida]